MKKRKGLLIPTLLLAGMLAGCNQAPAENKSSTTEAAPVSTVKADTPDWPRTFKDSLGKEIVIEKKPEKLASLWYFYPEILVALGEPPAASTEKEYLSSLAYLTGKLDRAEELGDKLSPSIEKILSVEPDLILATEQHEKMYDSLEKVAPVITLKSKDIYDDWQYGLRTLAEIIGKEDEAENVIAKMMKEITAGREALQSLQGESVALILSWDGKTSMCWVKEILSIRLRLIKKRDWDLRQMVPFKVLQWILPRLLAAHWRSNTLCKTYRLPCASSKKARRTPAKSLSCNNRATSGCSPCL